MATYSEFFPLKIVVFHSYVSLPEGTSYYIYSQWIFTDHNPIAFLNAIPILVGCWFLGLAGFTIWSG